MSGAWAIGLATFGSGGEVLSTFFPVVHLDEEPALAATLSASCGRTSGPGTWPVKEPPVLAEDARDAGALDALTCAALAPSDVPAQRRVVLTFIEDLDAAPLDAYDCYLRLHLLSHRRIQPHGCNLDGVFALLNNAVWTDRGPFAPDTFEADRLRLRAQGIDLKVHSVDKFPRMTDFVVPSGVRIGDADRVRLGAYLGKGTTVMHEGFVNFNAGTLGASMIEGRISAGVVVGDGTDVGGSASIMGTLSGGGIETIRVGRRCLLGANSGLGISLGDDCVVEAGLYVTAGTKVTLPDGTLVKARELSGKSHMMFRRHSVTGTVEMVWRQDAPEASWSGLRAELHENQ